jgi:hypothetical protein
VAEDPTNPFAAFMTRLQNKAEGSRGERKGVRKDTKPGDVKPTLTPSEVARYTRIFGVMKDVLNPGPEAERVSATKTGEVGGVAQMQKAESEAAGGGGGIPYGKIIGGLALAAGVIGAALATLADDIKGKFKEMALGILDAGGAAATEIGHLPAMALKIAKFIPIKTLKFLPLIGSLISFGMAWHHFRKNEYISALWELTSGIANLFPGVGTAISIGMDMIKFFYEANAPMDKDTGAKMDFGKFIVTKAKEIGGFVLDKIKEGKVPLLSGVWKLGEAIGYFIKGDWGGGLQALREFLPALLGQGDGAEMFQAIDALASMIGESDIGKKTVAVVSDSWSWIKDFFSGIGEMFSSIFTAISNWVDGAITDGLNAIKHLLPDALTGGAATDFKTRAQKEQYEKDLIEQKDFAARLKDNKKQLASIRLANDEHYDELKAEGGEEFKAYLKLMGYEPNRKIEDGMIFKDGNVTRFDDQDDVLAAKSGGPIDKMLDANSAVMSELNNVNKNQLNVLISIRDGINMLVSKSGGNTSTNIQYNTNPLTREFYA